MAMTASHASTGLGAVLVVGTLTIGEVVDISGPAMKAGTIDVTNSESIGGVREFLSGERDYGDVTFSTNLIPGVEDILADMVLRKKQAACSITLANGVAHTFDAYITGFAITSGKADPVRANVTMKCQPVVAA